MSAGKRPLPQSDDVDDGPAWVGRNSTPAPKRSSSSAPSVPKSTPKQAPLSRSSPKRAAAEVSAASAQVGDDDYYDDDDGDCGSSAPKSRRQNTEILDTPDAVRAAATTARHPYGNLRSSA
jgi:hypothetical protein